MGELLSLVSSFIIYNKTGACKDCKYGEHAAAVLQRNLGPFLRIVAGSILDPQTTDLLYQPLIQVLNRVVIHNLFDIKHLMQHDVSFFKRWKFLNFRNYIIPCLFVFMFMTESLMKILSVLQKDWYLNIGWFCGM